MCEIPAKQEQWDPCGASETRESTFLALIASWWMELVPNLFKQRMDSVSWTGAYKFWLCGSILPKDTRCHVTPPALKSGKEKGGGG